MTLINWHCHPGLTLLLPNNNNIHPLPPCEDAPLLIWSEGTNNINRVLSWLWFAQKFWWDAANLNEERRGRQGQRRKVMILCPTRHEKSTKHCCQKAQKNCFWRRSSLISENWDAETWSSHLIVGDDSTGLADFSLEVRLWGQQSW